MSHGNIFSNSSIKNQPKIFKMIKNLPYFINDLPNKIKPNHMAHIKVIHFRVLDRISALAKNQKPDGKKSLREPNFPYYRFWLDVAELAGNTPPFPAEYASEMLVKNMQKNLNDGKCIMNDMKKFHMLTLSIATQSGPEGYWSLFAEFHARKNPVEDESSLDFYVDSRLDKTAKLAFETLWSVLESYLSSLNKRQLFLVLESLLNLTDSYSCYSDRHARHEMKKYIDIINQI